MRSVLERILIGLLILNLAGCSVWTTTNKPLRDLEGRRVRLTTSDGKKASGKLRHADSLGVAVLQDGSVPHGNVTVTTSEIVTTEERTVSQGKTIGLGMLVAGALVFTLIQIHISKTPVHYNRDREK